MVLALALALVQAALPAPSPSPEAPVSPASSPPPSPAPAPRPGRVLVVPVEGQGTGPELAWVGEAFADTLPRALAALSVPVVDRADRLRAQDALEIPHVALTRATAIRVAEALEAERIVLGTYTVDGPALTLSVRILDVERASLSAPLISGGPIETLAERIYALAWDLALAGPAPPAVTRDELMAGRPAVPFEAFKAYAEGLAARDRTTRIGQAMRALSLYPAYDEARMALGLLQLEAREFEAARETVSRVRAAAPLSRPARFLEGVALLELGRFREAATLYTRLTAEDPTAAALNNQALALLRAEGASARPSTLLRQAVDRDPTSPDIPFNLGWTLLHEGDAEGAAFWLKGVVDRNPNDVHARAILSWALRQAGRAEEADAEGQAVASLSPAYESLLTPDLNRRFERVLHAERPLVLERDARTDAEVGESLRGRGQRLRERGDVDGALRELVRAVDLEPHAIERAPRRE